jgi:beta-phosphoglucomutase-like phosphatase (HAD superfamily)
MEAAMFDIDGTLTDSFHLHAKAWQMRLEHFFYNVSLAGSAPKSVKVETNSCLFVCWRRRLRLWTKRFESHRTEFFAKCFSRKLRPFLKSELFRLMQTDE